MMAQMVPRADWLARNLSVSSSSSWTALLGSTCAVRNFASVASERQAAAAGGAQTTTLLSAPPGSLLQVSANLSPVSVSHVMGLEQVSVTADAGAWRVAGRPRPDRSNSQVVECAEALRTAAAAAADAPPSPLSVTVPDRWIDMDITSRGGPIRVSKLQEATLRVASGGGAVDLGSVRATDLTIATTSDSRDGPLNAAEVSASTVELHTGRAPCSVSRLVGLQVRVSTSRAPLSAGTLLADKALITSLGGSINIANMRCSGYGHVQSGGGGLQVDGVDGVAELASGGGRVRAHAHDGLSSLVIFSEGGGVDLTLSSHITASIVVEGAAEVAATGVSEAAASTGAGDEPPASGAQGQQQRPRRFQATAQPASRQVQHADATLVDSAGGTVGSVGAVPAAAAAAGASVAPQPTARRLGPTPTANIRVHAGGTGRVTIRRLSWMEAMQERLKAKAA